jgi:AcrR family transcriptional regulator
MKKNKVSPKAEMEISVSLSETSIEDDGSARARVLQAATKLFAEKGLEGTSTREIAKAADLNISLISYYFGGKEGLYKTVISEFAEQASLRINILIDGLDLENMNRESFKEAMRTFLEGMLPAKFSSPEINILLQREMMAGLPYARDVYENIFSKILERVVSLYRIGQEKGFVKKELNPYIIFLSLVHATDMYVHVNHCTVRPEREIPQLPKDMKAYIRQIYVLFVEGVLV